MAINIPKVDLSQLRVSTKEIKEMISYSLFRGERKKFLQILKEKKFEKDKNSDHSKLLEFAQNKIENDKIRELSQLECSMLFKYLVAALGGKFLDIAAKMIERQVNKSLSTLRSGILANKNKKELEEMDTTKIAQFLQQLNKEHLLKWIFFLDNLPSVSKDETEESEVREACERLIKCFTSASVKVDFLKPQDWKLLKSNLSYFGTAGFFKAGMKPPSGSYFGILPYALESVSQGLSKGTRETFLRKTVEERLSLMRPPVISRENLLPFLLDKQKNYNILEGLQLYYKDLMKDIKRRRSALMIFSVYYGSLADLVQPGGGSTEDAYKPAYLDSIYHAINFDDFRILNEDGLGVDWHNKEKRLRRLTAEHLESDVDALLLEPIEDLRMSIHKGLVKVYVPLPIKEDEVSEEEEAEQVEEESEAPPEEVPNASEEVEASEPQPAPTHRETAKAATLEEQEPEEAKKRSDVPPPLISSELVRKNRNSHVLPIELNNINVTLVGNKPPALFHEGDEEE